MIWILLGIGVGLFLLIVALCIVFSGMLIKITTVTNDEIYKSECDLGRIDKRLYETLPSEEVWIESPFGYKLCGRFHAIEGSTKTVIIVHGVTSSLFGSIKYLNMFYKRGYNVLIYDHCRHGRSGGTATTYGFNEKYDLQAWVDWVQARFGRDAEIGIHGESMGAATALQFSALDSRAAWFVLDCPYSDLYALLRYRLKIEFGLPSFPFMGLTSFFVWLRTRVAFHHVSPLRDVRQVTTPMFFITGMDDLYIPPEMTEELYEAKQGYKKLYMAPNADHAEAFANNKEEYDKLVGEFLQEVAPAAKEEIQEEKTPVTGLTG